MLTPPIETSVAMISTLILMFLLRVNLAQKFDRMDFMHHTVVDADEKFQVFWTPDDKGFVMELAVMTSGYAAIGFSPNGGMTGADIFLGFINDNGQAEGMVSAVSINRHVLLLINKF